MLVGGVPLWWFLTFGMVAFNAPKLHSTPFLCMAARDVRHTQSAFNALDCVLCMTVHCLQLRTTHDRATHITNITCRSLRSTYQHLTHHRSTVVHPKLHSGTPQSACYVYDHNTSYAWQKLHSNMNVQLHSNILWLYLIDRILICKDIE